MNPHEIDVDHLFVCTCCEEVMNRAEQDEPCIIDGDPYCDICSSDLTYLRMEGYIPSAAAKTNKVVEAHNRKLDADLADMIYPIHTVRHI